MSAAVAALLALGPVAGFALGRWSARRAPSEAVRRLAQLLPDLTGSHPQEERELDARAQRLARRYGGGYQPEGGAELPPPPSCGSGARPPPPARLDVVVRRGPPGGE